MDRPSDQTSRAAPHFQWGPRDISFEDEVKAKRAAMGTRRSRPARRDHPGSGHQKRALSWSEGSTKTPRWTDEMEERLQEVRALAWKAQKKWSEDQEIYVQEVEKLEDMKEEYKKFVKRRKKDQKKEGSRYRSNISSRANSDDEADDDQPLKLGSILLRRVSTATSRNETENESQSDFRTRSSFSTNVSRNVSTGVSSADEDDEDEGEQSANPVGLASKVLRRVMTPLTSDSEKSQPKPKEKEKEKSKGLRGFLRRKSTSAAFDVKKQEEKKESIIA